MGFEKLTVKTPGEIEIMRCGGEKLAAIKKRLKAEIEEGTSAWHLEELATSLIEKSGGKPSFKMVPGYHWSTCVNVNDGLVHGVPKKSIVFQKNDLVSVDLGIYYQGFHTDTSITVLIGHNEARKAFLKVGQTALTKAIQRARAGNFVYDISRAIEKTLRSGRLTPIKSLVGHGIGRDLHEEPPIPCFTQGRRSQSPRLQVGMVLAIEVMYTQGKEAVCVDDDGWTIATGDGKISALFEETIAITGDKPVILT